MIEDMANVVMETGKSIKNFPKTGRWDGSQFKAEADRAAHESLSRALRKINMTIPVLSEEDSSSLSVTRPKRYWLIDPIDGTASFAHGYPGYVTQVALMEENKPSLAAIYAPVFDDLYLAVKGEGSFINGRRLSIPEKTEVETIIDNLPAPSGFSEALYTYFSCTGYVECGSIALKICKVAEGTADLFAKDVPVKDWDVAAPHLVLEEAGGTLTDIFGSPFTYEGPYHHKGVLAGCGHRQCNKVTRWYENVYRKGEVK